MSDQYVQLAVDGAGKKIDTSELTVSAQTVERQRIVISDDSAAAGLGKVGNATPGSTDYGLTVRTAGSNIVVGAAAAGAAISGNPVLNGGSDGTNARALLVDSTGKQLMVNGGSGVLAKTAYTLGAATDFSQITLPVGANSVKVIYGSGSASNVYFQASLDGSTWYHLPGLIISNGTKQPTDSYPYASTINPSGGSGGAYLADVSGWVYFRVYVFSGTASLATTIAPSYNPLFLPLQNQTPIVSGSNVIGYVYAKGSTANGSALVDAPVLMAGSDGVNVRSLSTDSVGRLTINSLIAGSALIGDSGVQYRANATGAATGKHIVSAASTNATNVKSSAGRVVGWSFYNTTSAAKFVKLHNNAGSPTAGAAVVQTIGIPPNNSVNVSFDGGIAFTTGIAYTITGLAADTDTTAVAAGDVVGDLFYA